MNLRLGRQWAGSLALVLWRRLRLRRRRVWNPRGGDDGGLGGTRAISIDDRMPPDHPYPAALKASVRRIPNQLQ